MALILVRYAEIGLKGKNLAEFENQLVFNIQKRLGIKKDQIKKENKQILISLPAAKGDSARKKLDSVFGIAWFSLIETCPTQTELIDRLGLKLAKRLIKPKDSFALQVSRADKSLPFTSRELEIKLGEKIRRATRAKVNLTQPDQTLYLSCGRDKTLIYTEKIPGPGGLPVGTAGKVLSLISGGFDSIVASYLLAKRGAQVDFLHFHVFPDSKPVLKSKIKTIVTQLSRSSLSKQLFLSSYLPFQLKVLDLKPGQLRHELVVFRRLMVRVGEELAEKHGYQALVLGDSLGQVASQTLENIVAVDQAVNLPIFRPLIGLDKLEIIKIVRQLGLEKITNQPYKDCCSLISAHPATRAHLDKIELLEKQLRLDQLFPQLLKSVETIKISTLL